MILQSVLQCDLQPCVIFELRCTKCGQVRMAISRDDKAAPTELSCPYCSTAAPASVLGTGQTRRLLPYFDRVPNDFEIDHRQSGQHGVFAAASAGNLPGNGGGDVHVHFNGIVDAKSFFQQHQGHIISTITDAVKKRRFS